MKVVNYNKGKRFGLKKCVLLTNHFIFETDPFLNSRKGFPLHEANDSIIYYSHATGSFRVHLVVPLHLTLVLMLFPPEKLFCINRKKYFVDEATFLPLLAFNLP